MSDYSFYKISGLSNSVQFGKDGGIIKYVSTATHFVLTHEDNSTLIPIEASRVFVSDGVNISSSTGTLSINNAQLGYDSSGSLQFVGNGAVIIPVGGNSTRPSAPKVGMIRVNIESTPYLETYNGTQWTNISGTPAGGSSNQIQYNLSGQLAGSSRYTINFSESQASTTINIGDPSTFSSGTSNAYIDGGSSSDVRQGTTINLRGGNNSGSGNAGSAVLTGGYAIGNGTQAGHVVFVGGESSVGNHGSILMYTHASVGGLAERFRIAGGSGAWGLNGQNYGSAGQVLTSNGNDASPSWTTISGVAKQSFAFNSNSTVNVFIVPTNAIIISVSVIITTPFNDPTTTITVGDAAVSNRLMTANDLLPAESGAYTVYPNYTYGTASQITLSITGDSTAGAGLVTISYQ